MKVETTLAALCVGSGGLDSRGRGNDARGNVPAPPVSRYGVAQLAPETQQKVEELLVGGATIEDVVEALQDSPGGPVPAAAVEELFRARPDLQRRRAQHLLQRADELKTALGDPESAQGRLAEAALLTGTMMLHRAPSKFTLKDAVSLTLQRQNLQLRRQLLSLQKRKAESEEKLLSLRVRHEEAKVRLARKKLIQLERKLRNWKLGERLDESTVRRIKEIYGIITQPWVPPQLEDTGAAAPAQD